MDSSGSSSSSGSTNSARGESLQEFVQNVARGAIVNTMGSEKIFQHEKVNEWTGTIIQECTQKFSEREADQMEHKYITTCTISQKTSGGWHSASGCFWETGTDISTVVRWENASMYCIVTVFVVRV